MKDDSLERLEMKMAYLERANNDLSDVVYRQQQELAALTERLAQLAARLDAVKAEQVGAYTQPFKGHQSLEPSIASA